MATLKRSARSHRCDLACVLIVIACAAGCTKNSASRGSGSLQAAEQRGLVLTLGVYQTDRASIMYRQFKPIATAIEQTIRAETGTPSTIRLKIFKTYDDGLNALVDGTVDFVRFGPASYVRARERNDAICLLAMEHKDGKKRFRGVVIVPEDSPIQGLPDLKSRTFAFGDENSTIGRYLVQAELVQAGIHGSDLADSAYLERHDKVARAVLIGDYDAGAIKENTLRRVNSNGKLRVIHSFENVTKPWIARSDLDEDIVRQLRHALLNLANPDALAALKIDGFLPASNEDYELVVSGMEIAKAF